MASNWSPPRQELTCPICRDIFRDPVLLPCSHSVCKVCVAQWWEAKGVRQCPVCKKMSSYKKPPRNLVLKNLCEAFVLEVESGLVCRLHAEKFKLYCEDHRTPVCVVCGFSREHKDHTLVPLDEAASIQKHDLCSMLNPMKEKVKLFHDVKVNWEKTDEYIKSQSQDTERKIREEFEVLRGFLQTEEELRIAALKEEEAHKRNVMKDKVARLTRQTNILESTIKATEAGLSDDDVQFLLQAGALTKEAEQPLPDDPQQVTGTLIDVAKYLGNLRFSVWGKMKEIVSYTPVILNPNTAHQRLQLETCLTTVSCGPKECLPTVPERMEHHHCVLGVDGYSSGSHSWDVEVGDCQVWALGVIAMDAKSMGDLVSKLWMLRFCNGKFTAFSPSCPASVLQLKDRPQRIRVQLDLSEGKLFFTDPDAGTAIHTFTHTFTGPLFPYFNTWSRIPLKVLPRKLCVTVKQL